jgi:hypothetical protein
MAADKVLRCDCGYQLQSRAEAEQLDEVRRHAWEDHGIVFSAEEALAVLLRLELELDEAPPADVAMVEDTASGKEEAVKRTRATSGGGAP